MGKYVAPKYPDALTAKSWSKEEGIVAKIVGKTDVSPTLAACEKAYKAVAWSKLDLEGALGRIAEPTAAELSDLYGAAEKEVKSAVKALDAATSKVVETAKAAESEFKKSSAIPKSSTAAAKKLHEAAKAFQQEISVAATTAALRANLEAGEAYVAQAQLANEKAVADALEAIAAAEAIAPKIKTTEAVRAFQEKHFRAIGKDLQLLLAIVPGLKDYHKAWLRMRKASVAGHPDEADDENAAKEYMAEVARTLKNMKQKLAAAAS